VSDRQLHGLTLAFSADTEPPRPELALSEAEGCAGVISSLPAKSAIVRAILSTRWNARAESWSRCIAERRKLFVLALAAMLGVLRYNLAQPHFDQTSLSTYNDQQKICDR
jgi:hypothetical protein